MDLVQFLRDRLDEDEAMARACAGDGSWKASHIAIYGPDLAPEVREHMARHDPARTLAEVDAKRQLLRDLEGAEFTLSRTGAGTPPRDLMTGAVNLLRRTVHLLALSYADHPDYREEWRP